MKPKRPQLKGCGMQKRPRDAKPFFSAALRECALILEHKLGRVDKRPQ